MLTDVSADDYQYSIFPDLPFGPAYSEKEDWEWQQIRFLFGEASLWAQAYEDGTARFVVAAEERWNKTGKLAQDIWKLTLGQLQNEYKRYCHFQSYHYEHLAIALRTRNSLAHKFYRRRMHLLCTSNGREQVIQELYGTIELFRHARDEVYWNLSLLTGKAPR